MPHGAQNSLATTFENLIRAVSTIEVSTINNGVAVSPVAINQAFGLAFFEEETLYHLESNLRTLEIAEESAEEGGLCYAQKPILLPSNVVTSYGQILVQIIALIDVVS
jgi:hypothetical protein